MNDYSEYRIGRKGYGRNTQTAATKIVQLIEPMKGALTRIASMFYRAGTADHILTLLRPCNRVTFTAAAAAGQKVITISADPGDYPSGVVLADNVMAAGDRVAYQAADGTWVADTINSAYVAGSATFTTNIPTGGVAAGGNLWWFGIETDTNPNDNQAHPRFNILANTAKSWGLVDGLGSIPDNPSGLLKLGNGGGQPLLLISDNATNAGFLESVGVEYVQKAPGGA